MNKLLLRSNSPIPALSLGLFRLLFGLIMTWEILYFYRIDFLKNFVFGPSILFNYEFLPLNPLPIFSMELLLGGLLISTILICIGLFYRIAIIYFFIVFSYFFLLDKGIYNNHLYLISLISFLMIFMNADAVLSFKNFRKEVDIPIWQVRILQFQIALVFFFGGLAKINPYWLHFHPVNEILEIRANASGINFITEEWFKYLIMLGGIVFDLCIPFLLWIKKTRIVAILIAICFNLLNSWLFSDINIFPFFMISALILFLDESELRKLFKIKKSADKSLLNFELKKPGLLALAIFIMLQLLIPLRHFAYPGYVDWTGEGQRFAWRMKIQHRKTDELKFAVFDIDKKIIHEIDPKKHLNASQYQQMSLYPAMIIQFADYLKTLANDKMGMKNLMVKSKVKVQFNGCPSQYIFNPEHNLLEMYSKYEYFDSWIEPRPLIKN